MWPNNGGTNQPCRWVKCCLGRTKSNHTVTENRFRGGKKSSSFSHCSHCHSMAIWAIKKYSGKKKSYIGLKLFKSNAKKEFFFFLLLLVQLRRKAKHFDNNITFLLHCTWPELVLSHIIKFFFKWCKYLRTQPFQKNHLQSAFGVSEFISFCYIPLKKKKKNPPHIHATSHPSKKRAFHAGYVNGYFI